MNNIDKAKITAKDIIIQLRDRRVTSDEEADILRDEFTQAKQDRRETYFFLKSINPDFLTGRQKIKRKELIKKLS